MNKEERSVPHTAIAQGAIISVISGILSLICSLFAISGAFLLIMRVGILNYIPAGREYLYPLFWLLGLLPPIATIIYSSYIKRLNKNMTEQREHTLAQIGFLLGCLSLALSAAVALAEIVVFFQTLGCMGHAACS